MKILGTKSVASILKVMVNVLWYFSLIISALMFVFMVVVLFLPKYNPGGWPILMDHSTIDYQIEAIHPEIKQIQIIPENLELEFQTPTNWKIISLQYVRVFIAVSLLLLLVLQIKRIINTLTENKPFQIANVRRLRLLAWLVLSIPLLKSLNLLVCNLYLRSILSFKPSPGHFIAWDLGLLGDLLNKFEIEYLFFGLIFLALAEIFRKGGEYRADSEAIV